MFVKLFNSWDMARDRGSYEWLMRILHVFCMAGVVYRADGNNDNLRSIWGLVKEAGFQISIIGVLPNSVGNDRLPDNGTRNAQDKIWAKVTEIDATTTQNPLLVQRFEFQLALVSQFDAITLDLIAEMPTTSHVALFHGSGSWGVQTKLMLENDTSLEEFYKKTLEITSILVLLPDELKQESPQAAGGAAGAASTQDEQREEEKEEQDEQREKKEVEKFIKRTKEQLYRALAASSSLQDDGDPSSDEGADASSAMELEERLREQLREVIIRAGSDATVDVPPPRQEEDDEDQHEQRQEEEEGQGQQQQEGRQQGRQQQQQQQEQQQQQQQEQQQQQQQHGQEQDHHEQTLALLLDKCLQVSITRFAPRFSDYSYARGQEAKLFVSGPELETEKVQSLRDELRRIMLLSRLKDLLSDETDEEEEEEAEIDEATGSVAAEAADTSTSDIAAAAAAAAAAASGGQGGGGGAGGRAASPPLLASDALASETGGGGEEGAAAGAAAGSTQASEEDAAAKEEEDDKDVARHAHVRAWMLQPLDAAMIASLKFPTADACAKYLNAKLSDVKSQRVLACLGSGVARSAEQLAKSFEILRGVVEKRIDVPVVVVDVDFSARVITVSQTRHDWLRLTAVSHRWEERAETMPTWRVRVDEDARVEWHARIAEEEARNMARLAPCWVDYACIVDFDAELKQGQMSAMALTYCVGRTAICGAALSPDAAPPTDYWARLWCKQEFSLTRMERTRAVRLALKQWLPKPSGQAAAAKDEEEEEQEQEAEAERRLPVDALGIMWGATRGFKDQQALAKEDDNRWPVSQPFLMSVGFGGQPDAEFEKWAQSLVGLTQEELEELMAHAFELRCWEPAVHNVKSVMEYLEHLCVAECAFDQDRVVGGVGCLVNLRGHKVPGGSVAQQFSDTMRIYNMCAVRFEPPVRGRAVLNSMMQLPQSAGPGPYATEFEVPQPMEVEVEVVRVQVRDQVYRWEAAVLIRGTVVGICGTTLNLARLSAQSAILLQPHPSADSTPPPDHVQVDQLGWMLARAVPVDSTLVKYVWEPPNAAARALFAMVQGGPDAKRTEGEWGEFRAVATRIGRMTAL